MDRKRTTIIVVLGMAGCGKTTFAQRLYSWLSEKHCRINRETGMNDEVFGANLDPACLATKMPLHYDIREIISVADLMERKKLGPNGAILTSLNLFVLQIDAFIKEIEKTSPRYVVIDTPGQVEMFTTSTSGYLLTKCLAKSPNTQVRMLYVVDGEKAQSQQCFVSNMVFASSVRMRFQEEVSIVVNKADFEHADTVEKWTRDFDLFLNSLAQEETISPTLRSIALWMEEFYNNFEIFHVSSVLGTGKSALLHSLSAEEASGVEGAGGAKDGDMSKIKDGMRGDAMREDGMRGDETRDNAIRENSSKTRQTLEDIQNKVNDIAISGGKD